MRRISREKVERMRNMILECFSAKYFSSPGSSIRFYSVAKWKLRSQSNACVLAKFFSTVEITTRENFRISLVVELGLNNYLYITISIPIVQLYSKNKWCVCFLSMFTTSLIRDKYYLLNINYLYAFLQPPSLFCNIHMR
jgi:hypothetical protein